MTTGVLGVVVVLAGAVALAAVVTQRDHMTPQSAATSEPTPLPSFAASPDVTAMPTPTALGTPTRRAAATARPTPTKKPEVRPSAPVMVLNASTVRGLAARSAGRVRSVGFAVTGVANYRDGYGRTTVCYRPGYAEQAWLLAGRLEGMQNVVPAPPGLPGTAALTLVVTEDFG
jgi:hypothetical protein